MLLYFHDFYKMVKDAGEDCTEKSCFAAARLSDVVRTGLKDG
jgi:hypothetical protein